MGYKPPGLTERPDDRALAGFSSLMPTRQPGIISRVLKAPAVVLALPFKLVRGVLRLPRRVFGRNKADNRAD